MDYVEMDLREHMDKSPESSDMDNVKVSSSMCMRRFRVQKIGLTLVCTACVYVSHLLNPQLSASVCVHAVLCLPDLEGDAVLSCAPSPAPRPEAAEHPH